MFGTFRRAASFRQAANPKQKKRDLQSIPGPCCENVTNIWGESTWPELTQRLLMGDLQGKGDEKVMYWITWHMQFLQVQK